MVGKCLGTDIPSNKHSGASSSSTGTSGFGEPTIWAYEMGNYCGDAQCPSHAKDLGCSGVHYYNELHQQEYRQPDCYDEGMRDSREDMVIADFGPGLWEQPLQLLQ